MTQICVRCLKSIEDINRSPILCKKCFYQWLYTPVGTPMAELKEQQMTHKFKVGDRVRYVNTYQKHWIGSTGTVIGYNDYGLCHVKFDAGQPCLSPEYNNCIHTAYEDKLELIPMQDKVLIKPEDYHTLKKDDEVEITVKGKFTTQAIAIALTSLQDRSNTNYVYKDSIISLYKLTPKATKLEVGEIVTKPDTLSTGWKVLHINKYTTDNSLTLLNIDNDISFNTNSKDMTTFEVFSKHTSFVRKSGIPIDWEATFS